MATTVRITNIKRHTDRLHRLRANKPALTAALLGVANRIARTAQESIIDGGIPSPNHIPSAPGEPPNADTHQLDLSIAARGINNNPPTVVVEAKAPYAAALEFGTSNIAARPYMRPATEFHRDDMRQAVQGSVRAQVRGK